MKKIFMVMAALVMTLAASAQKFEAKVDAEAKTMSIVIDTEFEATGVGFKFWLPEGVKVAQYFNEDEEEYMPSILKGSRTKTSATLDVKTTKDGGYSINIYGATFKSDATAPVCVVTLDGDLKGSVKFDAIAFTDAAAKSYKVEGFDVDLAGTGINAISAAKANGAIYNLAGQRVNKAQKGIFIQNGVKILK